MNHFPPLRRFAPKRRAADVPPPWLPPPQPSLRWLRKLASEQRGRTTFISQDFRIQAGALQSFAGIPEEATVAILTARQDWLVTVYQTLVELAEEHLTRMAQVPWSVFTLSIRQGTAGETFGCEVGGKYFDVGDQTSWLSDPDGDIRLVTHATPYNGDREVPECRVERTTVIRRA